MATDLSRGDCLFILATFNLAFHVYALFCKVILFKKNLLMSKNSKIGENRKKKR